MKMDIRILVMVVAKTIYVLYIPLDKQTNAVW